MLLLAIVLKVKHVKMDKYSYLLIPMLYSFAKMVNGMHSVVKHGLGLKHKLFADNWEKIQEVCPMTFAVYTIFARVFQRC